MSIIKGENYLIKEVLSILTYITLLILRLLSSFTPILGEARQIV